MKRQTVLVFRHVPHEGLGILAPLLKASGFTCQYVDLFRERPSFPNPASFAGLIILGGPMGVYDQDRHPFLKREIAYFRLAIGAGTPILGICLGSQLLAHALGARVYPNPQKEIGWYRVRLTPAGRNNSLFRGSPASPWVFQWHGDTFDLPAGAQRLASSPLCKNQAFQFRSNFVGLQFHMEVDQPMIRNWMRQPGARHELGSVGPRTRDRIERNLSRRLPHLHRLCARTLSGFVGRMVSRSPLSPSL